MVRRIEKPWGYEIIWAETDRYAGKILFIEKGHRLSLQYHEEKEETVYVINGKLEVITGLKEDSLRSIMLSEGESFHVLPKTIHRFCAPHGDVTLAEVSTTELDDVVRLADDYKRLE